ncbi:Acg family FMN-binding oxidoreductase [Trinickia sp.]|uniref:Acg family FMN-binding oxidoreductase n=1 Tax=Trinickia sp. TaxID=2571163 RepID=UPI003F80480A
MNSYPQAEVRESALYSLDSTASVGKKMRCALQHAVLAPSSHNSQPWHFIVDDDSITLCADRMRALPVVDPFDRELTMSCGAALLNLRAALNHYGLSYRIRLFPSEVDPDMLAHLQVLERGFLDESLNALFSAIRTRATVRRPFSETPLADSTIRSLTDAGEAEGARIVCLDDPASRTRIADLIAEADALQFADPCFRRELACWIHPKRSNDGMPVDAAGVAALLNLAVPIAASAIRTFDVGQGMVAIHEKLLAGSPLLLVIATDIDNREAWLAAGQALERLLLTATTFGLSASFLNQPIEIAPLRERLRKVAGLTAVPQLLLRIGYGPKVIERAPRRPLNEVLW